MTLPARFMNTLLLKSGMVLAAVGVSVTGRADGGDDFWGRFNLSYQAAFNLSAKFSGAGAYAPPGGPGSGTYDDGFVGVDGSHNAGGYTTYWGYNQASQISGGNVILHSSTSSGVATGDQTARPQNGFELSYDQPLGGGEHWHWGIEAAVNWTGISIQNSQALTGNVVTTTDAYSLGGLTPPVAPYTGTVNGPGPLLGTTPVSHLVDTLINAAAISGTRKIDANLFGFRLGPYVEWPLGSRFTLGLGAGLSTGVIDSDFSYAETVMVGGLNTQNRVGSGHATAALVGGYVRAQASLRLFQNASLFGGVEFNDLGTFDQTVGGETARLDLSQGVYVSAGFSYRF